MASANEFESGDTITITIKDFSITYNETLFTLTPNTLTDAYFTKSITLTELGSLDVQVNDITTSSTAASNMQIIVNNGSINTTGFTNSSGQFSLKSSTAFFFGVASVVTVYSSDSAGILQNGSSSFTYNTLSHSFSIDVMKEFEL